MRGIIIRGILGAAAAVLAASASAQAQPKFDCPIDWNGMVRLSGDGPGGLERQIHGLPVREWKPEHLDLALRRHDECQASAPGPDSLKKAEREFAVSRVDMYKGYLRQRDGQIAREAAGKQAVVAVQQSGSAQVQADRSRRLQLTYIDERGSPTVADCIDASRIPLPWHRLSTRSQDDLPRFFQACVQANQLPESDTPQFKRRLDELQRDRAAQKQYVAAVQALARAPQQQNEKTLAAVEALWRFNLSSDPEVRNAAEQLGQIRQAVDAKECVAHVKSAGVPDNLVSGYYLMESFSPLSLKAIICTAARQNVKFKYSGGGLIGDETLELKGKRSHVRIAVTRQKMHDGSIILVPVESRVDGNTQAISRANIQHLAFQIRSVLNNE